MTHEPGSSTETGDLPSLIAGLRQQVASLQRTLEDQARTIAELQSENQLLDAVINQIPYAIYWKDRDLAYNGCNLHFAKDVGFNTPSDLRGKTDHDLPWQPGEAAIFEEIDRGVLTSETTSYDTEHVVYGDGSQEWFETYKIPLRNRAGEVIGVLATYNNITARKQAEATVQAQEMLLQEVSTPVIPITDQIMVLPLVGTMDAHRAQQMVATVLEHLAASQAQVVILDITGVPIIDTEVAHKFIETGQAVQLLGARLILTGIRPEVAQALVGLGVELPSMITYGSLQAALADVYQRQSGQVVPKRR